ncbi:MAG: sulfotransferase domain-containing protein [Saprospiraceae bacterium]|nr:sulfotransferase domain-containing protein [Saprospiraceae bacterium]
MYKKPNFFILGAGKSGTTTLYKYLSTHPSIYLTKIKEPTFFCEDYQVVKNPITYFELFENATNESYLGEASHGYLSDPKSARLIRSLFPDSKFVIILRNPADRAYSLYNHMRRYRYEKITTFEKALVAENERINSEYFRKNNPQYIHNFLYFESGKYGSQIQRYLNLFDKRQFIFLKYDELIVNPNDVINKVCHFLDISPYNFTHVEYANKGFRTKSKLLDRLIHSRIISNKITIKLKLKAALNSINRSPLKPMKRETKVNLMKKYEQDLKLLYKLTGIRFD